MDHINLFFTKYIYLYSHQEFSGSQYTEKYQAGARLCALRISFYMLEESSHQILMKTFSSGADAQENSSLVRELLLTAQRRFHQLQLVTKDVHGSEHCAHTLSHTNTPSLYHLMMGSVNL